MEYVINVSTTSGNIQTFTFQSCESIQAIKQYIYNHHKGIIKTNHNSVHHLIYKGQSLDDNQLLGNYTIPVDSKLYFMSKTNPLDIRSKSLSSSQLDEYIISPQSNSPSILRSELENSMMEKKKISNSEILSDIHRMMKDIHTKIMNSQNI